MKAKDKRKLNISATSDVFSNARDEFLSILKGITVDESGAMTAHIKVPVENGTEIFHVRLQPQCTKEKLHDLFAHFTDSVWPKFQRITDLSIKYEHPEKAVADAGLTDIYKCYAKVIDVYSDQKYQQLFEKNSFDESDQAVATEMYELYKKEVAKRMGSFSQLAANHLITMQNLFIIRQMGGVLQLEMLQNELQMGIICYVFHHAAESIEIEYQNQ